MPPELSGVESRARKVVLDFEAAGLRANKKARALAMAAAALKHHDLFPLAMLEEAIRRSQRGSMAEATLELVAAISRVTAEVINDEATD